MTRTLIRNSFCLFSLLAIVAGCGGKPAAHAGGPPMQALPVQTATVSAAPVPNSDDYVATIKSRRSATISPQVDGKLTRIFAHSGDHVRAGQVLMVIDPLKQQATVDTQKATQQQKLAVYQYNQIEVERQRKLFDQGITSRSALDQAEQAYRNSKADYDSSAAATATQVQQLGYYRVAAPFDGIVGDIPVHVGDYVSSTTLLTTVDENRDLEAYIYVPAERTGQIRPGLKVDILDSTGKVLEQTAVSFISPQVNDQLQGILAKAPVHSSLQKLRNAQLVKARVIWSTSDTPVVPVLAVSRLGGQSFVFVAEQHGQQYVAHERAVKLGDTVGNDYAVLDGLKDGDKVIVSGIQLLVDGAPVQPLG